MPYDADAVVVGSGPNGLAAAVTLAAAGVRVQVIEGAGTPGGGCRTEELTLPGFRHDVCSAAHPLALASPFFRRFDPAARGVRFAQPQVVYAHPLDGGRAAVVTRSVTDTAARLGEDAAAYQRLMRPLADEGIALAGAVLSSMRRPPPYSAALVSYARLGLRSAAAVARRFTTEEARGLFAGAAAHTMLPLDASPTAGVALLLGSLAHTVGWPVVEGGSARLVDAMIEAIVAAGGQVQTGRWVRSLADLPPAAATLLDVAPRSFVGLAGEALPARYRDALARFRYGPGVCKVDFALSGPVPWTNEAARQAGTLHLGGTFEEIAAAEAEVARGRHPDSPYVLVVQAGVADPTRAPRGQHTLWAYCHVPRGRRWTWPRGSRRRSNGSLPGSAISCWRAAPGPRPMNRRRTPTTWAGTSPAARRPCARYWPARWRGGTRTAPRCAGCTCARRPLRPARRCTAGAANWRR